MSAEARALRAESKAQRALLDLLRAKYHPQHAAIVTTSACALLGHPEKYPDIPREAKLDHERGCCCGMRDWV